MPVVRKVYSTGSAVVVGIPLAFRGLTGIDVGVEVTVDVKTPRQLLLEMGVAPHTVEVMDLREEHFLVVRRHEAVART